MEDLKNKLMSEIEECRWELIEPHFKREAVIYLKKPNDLVQVGMLIADNKTHLIQGLMAALELYRPTREEANEWAKDSNKKFRFLIIRPFVLIQSL